MFRGKMQKLLQYLKNLPESNFDYSEVSHPEVCGTVGCVAGHTIIMEYGQGDYRDSDVWSKIIKSDPNRRLGMSGAADILDLSYQQYQFLFLDACGLAKRADAIRRIEFLLKGGKREDYDFEQESHGLSLDEAIAWENENG